MDAQHCLPRCGEIEGSGRLGLGKNLGLPPHDLDCFQGGNESIQGVFLVFLDI